MKARFVLVQPTFDNTVLETLMVNGKMCYIAYDFLTKSFVVINCTTWHRRAKREIVNED